MKNTEIASLRLDHHICENGTLRKKFLIQSVC